MIKKFINIEFRVTNGLIISGELIIVSYSAYINKIAKKLLITQ